MNYRTARILTLVYAVLMVAAAILAGSLLGPTLGHAAEHRSVALTDATIPPTYLTYLWPRARVTYAPNCQPSGYFSDVSAYRWDGRTLGPQRWNRDHDRTYWRDPSGGRVTFDGITFRNHTNHPVLVAGWCE